MTETEALGLTNPSTALDPKGIASALQAVDESKAKKDAREAVKAMTGTWEYLPVCVRSAVRNDIGRMVAAGRTKPQIMEAGYSVITVERAFRDLGMPSS